MYSGKLRGSVLGERVVILWRLHCERPRLVIDVHGRVMCERSAWMGSQGIVAVGSGIYAECSKRWTRGSVNLGISPRELLLLDHTTSFWTLCSPRPDKHKAEGRGIQIDLDWRVWCGRERKVGRECIDHKLSAAESLDRALSGLNLLIWA